MRSEKFWFEMEKDELPQQLFATINEIDTRQAQRYIDNLLYLSAYTGKRITGLSNSSYDDYDTHSHRIQLNVVQACVDTLTSKIGKNNPRMTVLTDNANYEQQQRAKKLSQFINGQFQKIGVYHIATKALKTACVFGDGFLKIWQENSQIMIERVLPHELVVDGREAMDGKPQTIYQLKTVSKHILKKVYPELADKIEESAKTANNRAIEHYDPFSRSDMVSVIEGWRLPSRKGSNDGRHAIAIPSCTLLDEKWDYDYFPFPRISFSEHVMGFWSAGVAEIIYTIQAEIDRVMQRISDSIWLCSVPRIYYEYSSKIIKEHFSNEIGSMVGYRGVPPQVVAPSSVSSDVFAHLDRLYQKAYELVGVSQLSIGAQKDSALTSGKAIRESQDVESDRFAALKQSYDKFHLDIANQIIDRAKEIYEYDKDYAVITQDAEGTEVIKWSDVDMQKDAYVMQVYPTNLLSAHPAGRLADVMDLMNGGLIEREDALALLDFPDIKAVMNIELAQRDDILATIHTMINTGKFIPPEPLQNLELGKKFCQAFYLKYKNKNVPDDKLNNLLLWITEAQALTDAMQPTAPMALPGEMPMDEAALGQEELPTEEGL